MHREALLAGRWYPRDPAACRAAIERHLEGADPERGELGGLIGPHAGWAFSGDCAGHAYAWLHASRPDAELVVVFGSHRGPDGPNSVFREEAWDTPLGALPTHRALADALARELDLAEEPARPLRADNAVELHLPFVKHLFPGASLLMLGVAASDVALSIGATVGARVREAGLDAIVIGSTDLTHYGPSYGFAPAGGGEAAVAWVRDENDRGFLERLLADDPRGAIANARASQSACCPGAAAASMEAARALRGAITPRLIDHTLSYDVRPDESFVGYAGVVF